jgi:hypothetical protein
MVMPVLLIMAVAVAVQLQQEETLHPVLVEMAVTV